jgi:hypothetical protein
MLVEASLVPAMGQHLGPVGREEAIAVRCRRIVVAAVGSVAVVAVVAVAVAAAAVAAAAVAAAAVAAVVAGGCIVLFLSGEGIRAGDRLMYQTTAFSSLLELVDIIYAVQVRHCHTRGSHPAHQTIHTQISWGLLVNTKAQNRERYINEKRHGRRIQT